MPTSSTIDPHRTPPAQPFDAAIGLGSNVGDKRANIARAIALLTESDEIRLVTRSRDYRSAPWGVTEQDWFVNAVVTVATGLSPRELLKRCQQVENSMGRVRQEKWGPRLIDVDILTYRDQHLVEPDLVIPHPLAEKRGFVLVPLIEAAPGTRLGGAPAAALLAKMDARDVVPLSDAK